MTHPDDHPAQALVLQHRPAMVRLARSLLGGDPSVAEDVVQDAFTVAFTTGRVDPDRDVSWLSGVVRNLARGLRRREARRASGESNEEWMQTVANDATPEAIQASLETQQHVVEAFSSLPDPYRSTLFLRYYKDLTPSQIARSQDAPLATVKSRLQRGLGMLRDSLDAKHGGERHAWASALVVLTRTAPATLAAGSVLGGGLLMSLTMTKISYGALAAAVLALLIFWPDTKPADRPIERTAEAPPSATSGSAARPQDDITKRLVASESTQDSPLDSGPVVRGRVIDSQGRGLEGLALLQTGGTPVVSEADGSFAVPLPKTRRTFDVLEQGWRTVVRADFDPQHPEREMNVILAPIARWAGRVRTPDGTPVPHPRIWLHRLESAVSAGTGVALNSALTHEILVHGDEHGWFEVVDAPLIAGLSLRVDAGPDFGRSLIAAPQTADGSMDVVLDPKTGADLVATGRVFLPDGRSAGPGVQVMLGRLGTRTDANGDYRLVARAPHHRPRTNDRLIAVAPRHLPAIHEDPRMHEPEGWPNRVDLMVPGPSRTMRGTVVGPRGAPIPDATIWIEDMTHAGSVDDVSVFVEAMSHGAPYGVDTVTSDAEGRFELPGLMNREYTLGVLDPKTLRRSIHEDLKADATDVVLRFALPDSDRTIAGRVLSRFGQPVAGVRISLSMTYREVFLGDDPDPVSTASVSGLPTQTDAEGRFTFEAVPVAIDGVRLEGDHILSASQPLSGSHEADALVVTVSLRRALQVVLAAGSPHETAASIAILDDDGHTLPLTESTARTSRTMQRARFVAGKTPVVSVSETASELVLYDESGEALYRQPLLLGEEESAVDRIEIR